MIEFTEDKYNEFIKSNENVTVIYFKELGSDLMIYIELWKNQYQIEIYSRLAVELKNGYDKNLINITDIIPLSSNYIIPFELVKTILNGTISKFKTELRELSNSIYFGIPN